MNDRDGAKRRASEIRKIAIGSDERNATTDAVVRHLEERGIEVELHGPLADDTPEAGKQWAEVSEDVARTVASGAAQRGVLFCWTGTGCSIAANKIAGVRAALCPDAETARGARKWNDANVLAMSLRLTTPILGREIVDAFLDTDDVDPTERENIDRVARLDGRRAAPASAEREPRPQAAST